MILESFYMQYRWANAFMLSIIGALTLTLVGWDYIRTPLMFMYSCFFKPLGQHGDQQSRLESFYQGQAKSMSSLPFLGLSLFSK